MAWLPNKNKKHKVGWGKMKCLTNKLKTKVALLHSAKLNLKNYQIELKNKHTENLIREIRESVGKMTQEMYGDA